MTNTRIFDQVKKTPKNVQKEISSGRLRGYTDINPMWRIQKLTELFGPIGIGWNVEVIKREIIDGGTEVRFIDEKGSRQPITLQSKIAIVDIMLKYKEDNMWSEGVHGTGGAMLVAIEKTGCYTDDDAFKKAETDAISNACKKLGFSADIYLGCSFDVKYNTQDIEEDVFEKYCSKADSMRIVNAAKAKWGPAAPEKCSEILQKYGADSTLSVLEIYVESVLEDIKKA